MPTFYNETTIDVSPYEFLSECTKEEIECLFDELRSKNLIPSEVFNKPHRNQINANFIENLTILGNSWNNMSKEDEEIINILAKKYS